MMLSRVSGAKSPIFWNDWIVVTSVCGFRISGTMLRAVRGGSWLSLPRFLRAASRSWFSSFDRCYFLGFRVGRTLTP
jgi:formylglycine-generating enzyme required for sulfatase activity